MTAREANDGRIVRDDLDFVALLRRLGETDPICAKLYHWARSGEKIEAVCYEAIRILAKENADLRQALLKQAYAEPLAYVHFGTGEHRFVADEDLRK